MLCTLQAPLWISIHALLAESDHGFDCPFQNEKVFLSTLSLRRATLNLPSSPIDKNISIHALLAESDRAPSITPTASRNFYPRSPCGERRPMDVPQYQILDISIHALLAESDNSSVNTADQEARFLSTLSLRRATAHGNTSFIQT